MDNKLFILILVVALAGIAVFARSRGRLRGRDARTDSPTATGTQPASTAKRAKEECELGCASASTRCNGEHSGDKTGQDRCDSAKASCVSKCR